MCALLAGSERRAVREAGIEAAAGNCQRHLPHKHTLCGTYCCMKSFGVSALAFFSPEAFSSSRAHTCRSASHINQPIPLPFSTFGKNHSPTTGNCSTTSLNHRHRTANPKKLNPSLQFFKISLTSSCLSTQPNGVVNDTMDMISAANSATLSLKHTALFVRACSRIFPVNKLT